MDSHLLIRVSLWRGALSDPSEVALDLPDLVSHLPGDIQARITSYLTTKPCTLQCSLEQGQSPFVSLPPHSGRVSLRVHSSLPLARCRVAVWHRGRRLGEVQDTQWDLSEGTVSLTLPRDYLDLGGDGKEALRSFPQAPALVTLALEHPEAVSNEVQLVALPTAALEDVARLDPASLEELATDLQGLLELHEAAQAARPQQGPPDALASRALRSLRSFCRSEGLAALGDSLDALALAFALPLEPSALLDTGFLAPLAFHSPPLEAQWTASNARRFALSGALLLLAQFAICFLASAYMAPLLARHPALTLGALGALVTLGLAGFHRGSPGTVQLAQTLLQAIYVTLFLPPKIETYCKVATATWPGAALTAAALWGSNYVFPLPSEWLLPRVVISTLGATVANLNAPACQSNPWAFPVFYALLTSLPLLVLSRRRELAERKAFAAALAPPSSALRDPRIGRKRKAQ